jgi:hypothetical protein
MLKRRNENDAKGETTIDRAGNPNGRLRPEHDILEAVAAAQTRSQAKAEREGTYDWWTSSDQDLGVPKKILKRKGGTK